jgi:hypothetical protein
MRDASLQPLAATASKDSAKGLASSPVTTARGVIVVSDQIEGAGELRMYPREGRPGNPHEHDPAITVMNTPADETDGVEVVPSGLSGDFARGLLVMMNSGSLNFQLYRWQDVASRIATR